MSLEIKIKAKNLAETFNGSDSSEFVLKNASKYPAELLKAAANQIQLNKVIFKKVPEWSENREILAHQSINLEQSSSQITAEFKATFLNGENALDLTGGLGVDSYFFSKKFKNFIHNEPDKKLSETVKYNFEKLKALNVKFLQHTAETFPFEKENFDWVYLDPSRRDESNNKIFKIEDCLPNLVEIQPVLFRNTDNIMVKFSPMLDIKQALSAIKNVKKVLIISEKNEVKELVFILSKHYESAPELVCVNLGTSQLAFTFSYEHEVKATVRYNDPMAYLYEPNSSIMKAGAFNSIAEKFGLFKIAKNSHLYTSEILKTNFPGRLFTIKRVTNYNKKSLNSIVNTKTANISCRNFPLKPEEVRKQLNWKEGGETYLFLTEGLKGNKLAIVSEKNNI